MFYVAWCLAYLQEKTHYAKIFYCFLWRVLAWDCKPNSLTVQNLISVSLITGQTTEFKSLKTGKR